MKKYSHIILFDGVCNLCNSSVQFILKRDKKALFKFASLQSDAGQNILRHNQLSTQKVDSIIYLKNNKLLIKSTAVLHIARQLVFPWNLSFTGIILPRFFRDWLYGIIAKNRYKWFGKKESCMLPKPEWEDRFLS